MLEFLKRNPNFSWVWCGQILSQSGARMYQIAIVWWILTKTGGSGTAVGCFMVLAALPSILFAKKIGNIIDRHSRKWLLVRCDLIASVGLLVSGVLAHQGVLSLPMVFPLVFFLATLQSMIDPTLNKALNEIITKGDKHDADFEVGISLLTTTQSLANFGGAVLGATLIELLGLPKVLFVAALAYFISSAASRVAKFGIEGVATPGEASEAFLMPSFLKRVLLGFALVNFFGTPTLVVLPVYTQKVLGLGADTLGALEAALWLGLVAGAWLGPRLPKTSRIGTAVACLLLFGAALLVPVLVVNPFWFAGALAAAGVGLGINNVKFLSLFQEMVPNEKKGWFFARFQAIIGVSFPIAYFLFGWLCDLLSPQNVFLIQGLGVLSLAVYFVMLLGPEKREVAWQSVSSK